MQMKAARFVQTRVAGPVAAAIEKAAWREGLSLASYVRRMLIAEARRLGVLDGR